jgi:hypothetical protein
MDIDEEHAGNAEDLQSPSSSEVSEEEQSGEDLPEASSDDETTLVEESSISSISAEEKADRAREMEGSSIDPIYISSNEDEDEVADVMSGDDTQVDSDPIEVPALEKKKSRKRGKNGGKKAQKKTSKLAVTKLLEDRSVLHKAALEKYSSSLLKLDMALCSRSVASSD